MQLGEKIQLSRKKKGLSQEDLANLLNVSRQAVQKWESGMSLPEINNLVTMSNIFDVSLDFLLKDIPESAIQNDSVNNNIEDQVNNDKTNMVKVKRLDHSRYVAIKVWLIIGCIVGPLINVSSTISTLGAYSALFLIQYAISIPLCVICILVSKRAQKRSDLIALGIFAILLLSGIGGILMLSATDRHFIETNEIVIKTENNNFPKAEENPAPVVEQINYSKKALQTVTSSISIVRSIKADKLLTKSEIIDALENTKKEAESIGNKEQYCEFLANIDDIMAPAKKILKRRTILAFAISASITIALIAAIVVPVTVVSVQQAQREREIQYRNLQNLIGNYTDHSSDNGINELIEKLDGYYDLTSLKEEYRKAQNYYDLTLLTSNYSGSKDDNAIQNKINAVGNYYKNIDLIKSDFTKVKKYVSTVEYNSTVLADDYVTDEVASANRAAITNLYGQANVSRAWDFNKYIATISVPYLVKGVKFTHSDAYFHWYSDSEGNHLDSYIPRPSSIDSDATYYFDTEFNNSKNSLKFLSVLSTNQNKRIDVFRIDLLYWAGSHLNASVYLYALNESYIFRT